MYNMKKIIGLAQDAIYCPVLSSEVGYSVSSVINPCGTLRDNFIYKKLLDVMISISLDK